MRYEKVRLRSKHLLTIFPIFLLRCSVEITHFNYYVEAHCQFKKNNVILDSWKQFRFREFYLDVSMYPTSTSNTSHRTRCYTDNTSYPDLPPNIIDMPCRQTARYVIVETTYVAPENNPLIGAILEICEIEIYGTIFIIHEVIILLLIFWGFFSIKGTDTKTF